MCLTQVLQNNIGPKRPKSHRGPNVHRVRARKCRIFSTKTFLLCLVPSHLGAKLPATPAPLALDELLVNEGSKKSMWTGMQLHTSMNSSIGPSSHDLWHWDAHDLLHDASAQALDDLHIRHDLRYWRTTICPAMKNENSCGMTFTTSTIVHVSQELETPTHGNALLRNELDHLNKFLLSAHASVCMICTTEQISHDLWHWHSNDPRGILHELRSPALARP